MSNDEMRTAALRREKFYFFVRAVFEHLHTGQTLSQAQYLEAMCFEFQQVAEGRERRLIATVPPRHLKSICASVALAAWMLGHDPTLKIIVASYGDDLARRHSADFRRILESPWYQALFPNVRIDPRGNRADEIRTTAGGGRKAVSLGGAVTGFGADVIIIDDLLKAQDALSERRREEAREYFELTLYSRLNDKRSGRIIVIQQRLHEDDFASYILEKGTYRHLNFPAIASRQESHSLYLGRSFARAVGDLLDPEREPRAILDSIRDDIGAYAFSAQYLQNPVAEESCLVHLERMTLVEQPPPREKMQFVIQSWDTATKDKPDCDFSVCSTWGCHGRWYLLDVYRARLEYPELKAMALKLKQDWAADRVLVEDSNNGRALVQQLRSDGDKAFIFSKPKGSKLERLIAQSDILQSEKVVIPTQPRWFDDFRREILVFPNGRHDDQVDSVTQFLQWAQSHRGRAFVNRDPVTRRRIRPNRRSRQRRVAAA